ncbi:MAG: hypothetical protein Ta2B_12910 [Termitinemataceae bacterium]|nr:MAG: hypothetical protein Ta2B_12910 [Termitinemataceae bacterium]
MKTTKKWSKILLSGMIGIVLTFGMIVSAYAAGSGWKFQEKKATIIQGEWKAGNMKGGIWTAIPDETALEVLAGSPNKFVFKGNSFQCFINNIPIFAGWFRLVEDRLEMLITTQNTTFRNGTVNWRYLTTTRFSDPSAVYTFSLENDNLTLSSGTGTKVETIYLKLIGPVNKSK